MMIPSIYNHSCDTDGGCNDCDDCDDDDDDDDGILLLGSFLPFLVTRF